ncbi:ribbon-helix-helix domain-containing protein [Cerasicoccus fimbriatus]|uniref:ribbon-helix-helix domain-containing protein n=1 Tax=Cerasicoccus fimbriatus TaxID=3014554 RepID=UPI0022B40B65|nr:ribbon-helix-helix domain-containing protein [Cerasicoccus sp. TK19100]
MAKKKTAKKAKRATPSKTKRAPGKTQISISLPIDLIEKVDKLAAAQNRNRSNFIATALENLTNE